MEKDNIFGSSMCSDCIWCRGSILNNKDPLRCVANGYNKILHIHKLPTYCEKWSENW